jgi:hypothetical protein
MRLAVPFAMVAALLLTRSAHATPSARLVYARSADAVSCPDENALRKAVAARFGYDPFFAWAKQTVVVQISHEGGRYTARVQLVDDHGLARGTRDIASDEDNCSELFDAAALAISIALDASINAPAARATDDDVVAPPAPPAAPLIPDAPPAPASLRDVAAPTVASPGASPFWIGGGALLSVFAAPNPAPGIAAFGDFRARVLSLGVELQADVSIPRSETLPQSEPSVGHVMSARVAVTIAPCAHRRPAFVCALAQVGWLHAWGWGLSEGGSGDAPLVAAGGRVGAEWPLSSHIFMRIHADLLGNLNRADFQLDNQTPWPTLPVIAALGMGLESPLP